MTENANPIAQLAAKFINNTNQNVFLTGKAGTGKTTFLRHITRHTYKNAVIAAPTGIAAINAGGVTLHSLFQLPFGAFVPDNSVSFSEHQKLNTPKDLFRNLQIRGSKRQLLQELELLIIDEVSMLRADLLDAIDTVLKGVRRKSHLPFGGVQVLFIGDLLQLPPVVKEDDWRHLKNYYKTPFFFDAKVLQQHKPLYLELDKIFRQQDDTFISVLNNLRNNTVTPKDIELLNAHYQPAFRARHEENYIHLTTHNYKADQLNRESLQKLGGKSYFFKAETEGDFPESAYPVEANLELKKEAQVMFIKNDPNPGKRYFNGKIGVISEISEKKIKVKFSDCSPEVEVEKYEWPNIKYTLDKITNEIEEQVQGTFSQYPIKLAWAITVHKSQGLTFEKAIVDIGDAFAPGQVYVALSRLTSLKGLVLSSRINTASLNVDENISEFSQSKPDEKILEHRLEKESFSFFRNYILQSFDLIRLDNLFHEHVLSYDKAENRSMKQKFFEDVNGIYQEIKETKITADKFLKQLDSIFQSSGADFKKQLQDRVGAAKTHFEKLLKGVSKKIFSIIEKAKTEKRMKLFLEELLELDKIVFKQIQQINKADAMVKTAFGAGTFSKEEINAKAANEERKKEFAAVNLSEKPARTRKRKIKGESTPKPKKEKTHDLTMSLYLSGKTIAQIAQERNLAVATIESHLFRFVPTGKINISDFVSDEKRKRILETAKKLGTQQLSPIKQELGDDYSYTEIRFAVAEGSV